MSRIDGLSQVMALLRQQLADTAKRSGRKDRSATPSATSPRPSTQALQQKVRERLRTVEESADRDRKSTRIFLESVLTWEFGDALANDPKFSDMVNEIDAMIDSDKALQQKLRLLIRELVR